MTSKEPPPGPTASGGRLSRWWAHYNVHFALFLVVCVNALYSVLGERMLGRGGAGTHPVLFSFWRTLVAWPLLHGAAVWYNETPPSEWVPDAPDRLWVFTQGFLGVFTSQVAYLTGVGYAGATVGSIVNLTLPLWTAIISVLLGMEPMRWQSALGIALAVSGGLVMKVGGMGADQGPNMALGVMLFATHALASAVYYIMQLRTLIRYPPLLIIAWENASGCVVTLLLGFVMVPDWSQWRVSKEALVPLAFTIIANSCIKYTLNAWCNKQAGAVVVTLWATLTPVVTAGLSWFMLSKPLSWSFLGGVPIVAGTGLYMRGKQLGAAAQGIDGGHPSSLTEPLLSDLEVPPAGDKPPRTSKN